MPVNKYGHEYRTSDCPSCGDKILDPRDATFIEELDYRITPSGYDIELKHGSKYRQPYHRKCILRLPECCGICGKESGLIEHHVSWIPEYTIPVCGSCHNRIHRGEGLEGYCPTFNGRKFRHDAFDKILSIKWEKWLP